MVETWRVVLDGGTVIDVSMTRSHIDAWRVQRGRVSGYSNVSPRTAVVSAARNGGWPVAEILAPGELSKSEAVEAAKVAMREACAKRCTFLASVEFGAESAAMDRCADAIRAIDPATVKP